MAYTGYKRYLGVAKEGATWGSGVAPSKWYDFITEGIAGDPSNLYLETAGQEAYPDGLPGPWKQAGPVEMLLCPENCGEILLAAFGKSTPLSGASVAWQHTFELARPLGSLTLEIFPGKIGSTAYPRRIEGVGIKSLKFEAAARELCIMTVETVGKKETILTSSAFSAHTEVKKPFTFWQSAIEWGGSPLASRIEAFRCTLENPIDDDAFVLDTRFLPGIKMSGHRMLTGEMDIQFESWDEYRRIYGGDATQVTPISGIDASADFALKLVMTGGATNDATYANYKLELDIPHVRLDTSEANVDKRERIVQSVGFTALEVSGSYLFKAILWNRESSY